MNPETAETARETAGINLETAAKQLRLHPRSLRRLELHGCPNLCTAERIARHYQCDIKLFLPKSKAGQKHKE